MVGSRVHSDVICGVRDNGISVSGALPFCAFHNWDNSLRRRPQHKCALTCMLAVLGDGVTRGASCSCLAQPLLPLLVTVSSFVSAAHVFVESVKVRPIVVGGALRNAFRKSAVDPVL
ncbi:hypothetical protein CDAR_397101 [Caerostris darwini]|uniref:Uncharacterized protein n=1 Tax=Caerostris darwini TaxID=1538125 RepID=A0AAV4MPU3_9ARAC|nr:hypothetical protein CDAR_397101 [Caerostris darwini]